ncbi:TonB-dependent receptor domain-containing protein [Microbulbifer hydrolyticus]|uniref:Outer membrane receptor protein involved in Fe transport n=1 Tax=Microbulbifer hydrolyticus TaxID=48074 RepID=A0A6P1TD02_9GAMM|nr:TonB-dependent receptor [Microbulbifer hydrolyticus]MBB5210037.1 outer membrane receptor protein involved in Fe transport [Microbulbifer hydrolyticus]QHQ39440.1 TonB-dependent receptor [Microbulbifer hydrolyticus]
MDNKDKLSKSPLSKAIQLALGCSLMSGSALAIAQKPAPAESTVEEVVVTGTHIKGLDTEGAVQVVQINRDDIEASGATSPIEILQQLSQTGGGSGTFSTATSGALSSSTPVGAAGVSLRGLGASSTLVLVNGRRVSVSSFAKGQESFVDVNSIPLSAIERVEVLPSGAAATYGADAVAGVVNFVLRDDFDGSEISLTHGNSTAGTDEGKYNLNWVWGREGERSHTMVVVDLFSRNAMYDRDRELTANSVRPSQQGVYPSFNDFGWMWYDQTEDPASGGCPEDQFGFGEFGEYCEFNTNAVAATQDEYESANVVATFNYDLSDNLEWFNTLMLQASKSSGTSSPANFSRAPFDPESPYWPEALKADMIEEGGVDDFSDFYGWPVLAYGKFPDARAVEVENESMRLVSGLRGEVSDWNWEVAANLGRSESEQRGVSGLYKADAFYNASVGNLCTDGSVVDRWEVDFVRPGAGFGAGETCEDLGKTTAWYNPFGGQVDQMAEVAQLIRTDAKRGGTSSLYAIDGNISGSWLELPAGAIQVAFGGEFRRESVKDTPSGDAVSTTLNPEPILGFSSTSADAARNQWAVYMEQMIPLAANTELQFALRYDHYDSFGGDANPKVALRHAFNDAIIFRSNWSTSFRAPSLAQTGAGTLLSSYRTDCSVTPEACDGDPESSGLSLFSEDVSNDDLQPETATTWGAGFLLKPFDDTEITVDYWNIEHENLIGIEEDDFILRAFNGEFPIVGLGELPTGQPGLEVDRGFVVDAHFQLSNLGWQKTNGVDVAFTQYFDTENWGSFRFTLDGTYLNEFDKLPSDALGIVKEAGNYTYPRWLANSSLRWRYEDWSSTLSARYTHSYMDDPDARVLNAVFAEGNEYFASRVDIDSDGNVEVDSWLTFDLNVARDFDNGSWLSLRVNNLLDEEPPLVLGTGANVDHFNHDSMGRFYTLSYGYSF